MRLATLLCVLALLGAGTALADKVPEKEIVHYDFSGRTDVDEVEPNQPCEMAQEIECGDVVHAFIGDGGADLDWFKFWVDEGLEMTIGTDEEPAGGSIGDSRLWLYSDDCTTELAFDDDGGPGLFSLITFTATYSGYYYALVDEYGNNSEGNYIFFAECDVPPPPPENDTCDGAIEIERCTSGEAVGIIDDANNDYDPEDDLGNSCTNNFAAVGPDLVWMVDLEVDDIIHCVMDANEPGPYFDASLYLIYDCEDPVNSCVIGSDAGNPEEFTWTCDVARTYYIICDAYGSYTTTGGFTLYWDIECPVTPADETTWGKIKATFR